MKNINISLLDEIERICEALAALEDPCLYCCENNGGCFDACMNGKVYDETVQSIKHSISQEAKPIYEKLEEIGWVKNKIQEKRDILDIIQIRKDQEECHNKCSDLLKECGLFVDD